MKASLDTNVMIHLYRANQEHILFDFFKDGIFIFEQIRNTELVNHGLDVIEKIDYDIEAGKIEIYTRQKLMEQGVLRIFEEHGMDFLKLLLYLPDIHNKTEFLETITFINSGTDLRTLQDNFLLLKNIARSIKKRNHSLYYKMVKFVSSRAIFIKIV